MFALKEKKIPAHAPIWLTNRGLNATICCLSQLCKYFRLTNWRFSLYIHPQAEKRRPWGNVYHQFVLLTLIRPYSSFLLQPYCTAFRPSCSPTSFLVHPYVLPHAAVASSLYSPTVFRPSCSPSSSLM